MDDIVWGTRHPVSVKCVHTLSHSQVIPEMGDNKKKPLGDGKEEMHSRTCLLKKMDIGQSKMDSFQHTLSSRFPDDSFMHTMTTIPYSGIYCQDLMYLPVFCQHICLGI